MAQLSILLVISDDLAEALDEMAELTLTRRLPARLMTEVSGLLSPRGLDPYIDMIHSPGRIELVPGLRMPALLANMRAQALSGIEVHR